MHEVKFYIFLTCILDLRFVLVIDAIVQTEVNKLQTHNENVALG